MATPAFPALHYFADRYSDNRALQQILQRLSKDGIQSTPEEIVSSIHDYNDAIGAIGDAMWQEGPDDALIQKYQQLYQELEQLIALKGDDSRHRFIITIPVADRPQHLQSCLDSLLTLCRAFHYGETADGRYPRVMALIADDSREAHNIARHREIAAQFNREGIETLYFGIDQQLQQLDRLSDSERASLQTLFGKIDRESFYHKGASIMRNIAYLKLRELTQDDPDDPHTLCYFIDSDQEFRVKSHTPSGEQDLYAISYFHALDQIFEQEGIEILTGKVVGDPPVSPSVMAGNFMEDVIAFLHQMREAKPDTSCQFHDQQRERVDEASYHDMADLFGFKPTRQSYHYNCTLSGPHDNRACFESFAHKLNQFFDGAHPTRKSYYQHAAPLASLTPARTVYTGNYIFRPTALDYFIPFATLKLRMAGPVLGRIIKSEIGAKFVSANLPMLHKRTVDETGQSEFRPGINRERSCIDLSGEFERQFFGDVMLFTMEKLTQEGYPQKSLTKKVIDEQVRAIEATMQQKYQHKQAEIIGKISLLKSIFNDAAHWWNRSQEIEQAKGEFSQFIANIDHNFGESARAYELIGSKANREQRMNDIVAAIDQYSNDRASWKGALSKSNP